MYMEQWDNGCMTILLSDIELSGMGIRFEEMDSRQPATREALHILLAAARRQAGLPPEHRLRVEALPIEAGCLLLVTPLPRRRSLRMRRPVKPQVYAVDCVDHLLSLAAAIGAMPPLLSSSLYRWQKGWRLVVYPARISPRLDSLLAEYGRLVGEGDLAAAATEEHGTPIVRGDALDRLIQAMVTANG